LRYVADSDLKIIQIDIWPIDVNLTDDFVISSGKVTVAENCFVRVSLSGGAHGYGEIAPFPDITGEDRATSHRVAERLSSHLIGESAAVYRKLSSIMFEAEPHQPAARCGLETAILDAFCRALGIPLWALWGGANLITLETDITIPILDIQRSIELAKFWYQKGFKTLKLKIGSDIEEDIRKVCEINRIYPNISWILDANQGFTESEALNFIKEVIQLKCKVLLFEQPVAKQDLAGMAAIKDKINIPVAADESVATAKDALAVIAAKAADVINIKITKSGVMEALKICTIAQAAGLEIMFGGMVETRLAMSCSLSIALGLGGARILDLDTPLLLLDDPLEGGYQYDGPEMSLWSEPGLGMKPKNLPVS
jgi:L-alanine-DL-glutamate epimerase-like enolase superfamily enzyme